jgi:flavin reductase (DIM6/NTAB) family NADH-FMN oxidoreductase RutF
MSAPPQKELPAECVYRRQKGSSESLHGGFWVRPSLSERDRPGPGQRIDLPLLEIRRACSLPANYRLLPANYQSASFCVLFIDKLNFLNHMPVSPNEFRQALSRFASGITVVSVRDSDGKLHGITVSAFCSVSLNPPLVLVCIEKTTGSNRALLNSGAFTVNILSEHQSHLSEHFASLTPDKFDHVDYETGTNGLPVLKDIAASLECRVTAEYEAGDHTIFIGEVEKIEVNEAPPLVYLHGDYRQVTENM